MIVNGSRRQVHVHPGSRDQVRSFSRPSRLVPLGPYRPRGELGMRRVGAGAIPPGDGRPSTYRPDARPVELYPD
jgi:hypothetical protein